MAEHIDTETLEEEETQETQTPDDTPDVLDMSDDEFEEFMASGSASNEVSQTEENDPEPETGDESEEEENHEDTADTDNDAEVDEPAGDDQKTDEPEEKSDDAESQETGTEADKDKADTKETPDTEEVNYEAEYKKILAPFKANGREIKVDSVDEALTLMKMGANYNKKMAAIKPNLRVLKTLEKADLLDESKLNYLIDLAQKKPEAIAKLVKEADIDPLDIDTDNADKYVPSKHGVSDTEVAIDSVLDEIKDNESFGKTIKVVTEELDEDSRSVLAQQPEVIKVLDEHIQTGIYDKIMSVVEKERMLGRLNGVSDLAAYKAVGDRLHAQGAFSTKDASGTTLPNQETHVIEEPVRKRPDPKVVAKKKAAGSVRSKPARKQPEFDPLALSDEEFEKITANRFF